MAKKNLKKIAKVLKRSPANKNKSSRIQLQKITPHLWFNENAEEAVKFYVSVFKNSKIKNIARYGAVGAEVSGNKRGSVMTIEFQLEGQQFIALNGGPQFTFSPAISFLVNCKTQQEIDYLWEKLSENGKEEQCGWLKDKYGVSWQIVPGMLSAMILDKDEERAERVMKAMLPMKKLDIQTLKEAYEEQYEMAAV